MAKFRTIRSAHPQIRIIFKVRKDAVMIYLSQTAAREIDRLRATQHGDFPLGRLCQRPLFLRLSVGAGSCEPLSYQFSFEAAPQTDDRQCESEGISILINEKDLPYLQNLHLDYAEDLMGGGFRFNNPNANRSCRCGHTFHVE